ERVAVPSEPPRPEHRASTAELIEQHGVTCMQCTPSFARMLLENTRSRAALGRLRKLLIGGEAFPPELATALGEAGVGSLFNMYGPTETTVWSAVQRVEPTAGAVTLGPPIANTQLYVLDEHQQRVPRGVRGELYIGGEGLARGYWRSPALTAERFIPDPFSGRPGARLYRTGDMVRQPGPGRLEFLGRMDHQVKIRGFRIELGEVEELLATHPQVAQCVVVPRRAGSEDAHLVAYCIGAPGARLESSTLREFLRASLPEHLVPALCVQLDAFPLTPNGKVDRGTLARQELDSGAVVRPRLAPPRNALEGALQQIWQGLLGLPQVGIFDNFFQVGGHSILAVKLHRSILDAGLGQLELIDLFTYPTIDALASHLARAAEPAAALVQQVPERVQRQREALLRQQQLKSRKVTR
ncbi:MAG: non-ribosomal peptide synthetase, partial [Archangium sp.]